jgi:demethylmenaquinone methyltransferase / 2-methoxy-6-polyprenyl-1,4-benzoquinol methylase
MFARIAGVYDLMNRLLSLGLDGRWRRALAGRVDPQAVRVLDLCTGTGDLALEVLAAAGARPRQVLAADFCLPMLRIAARKRRPRDGLALLAADALHLPLPDGTVDAVTVAFGVRNLADPERGLAEAARVLRPGGQLLVLEFFRPDPEARGDWAPAPALLRRPLGLLLPLAGRLVARDGPAYAYLAGSMAAFLSPAELAQALGRAGFGEIGVAREALGVAHLVHARKLPCPSAAGPPAPLPATQQ